MIANRCGVVPAARIYRIGRITLVCGYLIRIASNGEIVTIMRPARNSVIGDGRTFVG